MKNEYSKKCRCGNEIPDFRNICDKCLDKVRKLAIQDWDEENGN